MTLNALYDFATMQDLSTYSVPLKSAMSLSFPDGTIGISSDRIRAADEKVCLAHEIGHCVTGSFYNINSPLDVRGQHEYRANKWAYQHLLPYNDLIAAVKEGITETWEIAEYFGLPEEFTIEAIAYYRGQEHEAV